MRFSLFSITALAGLAIALPGQKEDEVTVTNYKTVTSCFSPAPTCSASASTSASASISASASTTSVPAGYTVSTIYSTKRFTITSCASTVKYCPARSTQVVTSVIPVTTTTCPVKAVSTSSPISSYTVVSSTVYSTSHIVITTCASTVLNCPARSTPVTTYTLVPISTAIYTVPHTDFAPSTAYSSVPAVGVSSTVAFVTAAAASAVESVSPTAPGASSVISSNGTVISPFVSPSSTPSPESFKGAASSMTVNSVLMVGVAIFGGALLL